MSMRLFAKAASGQFNEAMREAQERVRVPAMKTAHEAAHIAKMEGEANIAASGMGLRWQKALHTKVYPERAMSTHPTVHIYHKIPYSGIFETGGRISGSPLLWVPLPSAPKRIGHNKMTPKNFIEQIGPLFTIHQPGRRPLLAANISTGKRKPWASSTLSALRRGAPGGRGTQAVPVFYGISSVELRDRFSITEISEKVAEMMPAIFAKQFDGD